MSKMKVEKPMWTTIPLLVQQGNFFPLFKVGEGFNKVGSGEEIRITKITQEWVKNLYVPYYDIKVSNKKDFEHVKEGELFKMAGFMPVTDGKLLARMFIGASHYESVEVKIQWSDDQKAPVAVGPGKFDKTGKIWEPMVCWYDVQGRNVTRWVLAGVLKLWSMLRGIELAKGKLPPQYITKREVNSDVRIQENGIQVSCLNCAACRRLKTPDTHIGDSDTEIGSVSTMAMKDYGSFAMDFICGITGQCPGESAIIRANELSVRGEDEYTQRRMVREAPVDAALNCRMYTFKGDFQRNIIGWKVAPGSLPFEMIAPMYRVKTCGYELLLFHEELAFERK